MQEQTGSRLGRPDAEQRHSQAAERRAAPLGVERLVGSLVDWTSDPAEQVLALSYLLPMSDAAAHIVEAIDVAIKEMAQSDRAIDEFRQALQVPRSPQATYADAPAPRLRAGSAGPKLATELADLVGLIVDGDEAQQAAEAILTGDRRTVLARTREGLWAGRECDEPGVEVVKQWQSRDGKRRCIVLAGRFVACAAIALPQEGERAVRLVSCRREALPSLLTEVASAVMSDDVAACIGEIAACRIDSLRQLGTRMASTPEGAELVQEAAAAMLRLCSAGEARHARRAVRRQ